MVSISCPYVAAAQVLVRVAVENAVDLLGDDDRRILRAEPRLVVAAKASAADAQGLSLDDERGAHEPQQREEERLALAARAAQLDELAPLVRALEECGEDAVEHCVATNAPEE